MGEEKKESSGVHSIKEGKEKQKSEDKQDNNEIIVIKVDMLCHCDACAKKIARALRASQGVEDVAVDRKTNVVVVKGKTAEPMRLCDRIQHKTGRNAHLLSPLPKPPEEQPKDDDNKDQHQQQQQQQQQKADQPPPVVTVVLGIHMHCEACAQLLRKRILKLKGVESVETDVEKGEVKVKGVIADPEILVKYVHKKTRKQVSLLAVNNNKDDDEQQGKGKGKGRPQDIISEQKNKAEEDKKEEKGKQDNVDDNTSGMVKNIDDQQDAKMMMMTTTMMGETNRYDNYNNYWPSSSARYDYMDQYHQPHSYHDNNSLNNYQPQVFSDENPNACSIM